MIVLPFKNDDKDPTRSSFDKFYMILVEITDFNALIYNKPFFINLWKTKQETSEKLIKMLKIDGYTTVNLSDFSYYQNYYKPISIDLSKKVKKFKYFSKN